ncbi:MAG: hypothetical protein ACK4VK_06530 [Aquificaceae bacterium]
MKKTLDLNLMEEFANLEYFVVKAPVNSPDFWKEWQEKYSRAFLSRVAVKKLLKTRRLSIEELKRYKALLGVYEDLMIYFESLKRLALSLRGVFEANESQEFDDDDIDLEF